MSNPAVSGLASDIRRRLVIDRYSSVLSGLPLRRQGSLADPRSADAEIWNVFRTLAQMDPALWLPGLLGLGRIRKAPGPAELSAGIGLTLWKRVRPPAERLAWLQRRALKGELRPAVGARRRGRVVPLSKLRDEMKARARRGLPLEDPVEVDAIVKCRRSVLFVEIPSPEKSPDEPAAADVNRTHLLRLVDAGISYAESRSRIQKGPVDFSLLVLPLGPESQEPWTRALRALTGSPSRLRRAFPHRGASFDPSPLLGGLGVGSWPGMRGLLSGLRREVSDPFEAALLDRLLRPGKPAESPAAS